MLDEKTFKQEVNLYNLCHDNLTIEERLSFLKYLIVKYESKNIDVSTIKDELSNLSSAITEPDETKSKKRKPLRIKKEEVKEYPPIYLGLQFGGNYNFKFSNPILGSNWNIGYHAGLTFDYKLSYSFALGIDLSYIEYQNTADTSLTLYYIPALLTAKFFIPLSSFEEGEVPPYEMFLSLGLGISRVSTKGTSTSDYFALAGKGSLGLNILADQPVFLTLQLSGLETLNLQNLSTRYNNILLSLIINIRP